MASRWQTTILGCYSNLNNDSSQRTTTAHWRLCYGDCFPLGLSKNPESLGLSIRNIFWHLLFWLFSLFKYSSPLPQNRLGKVLCNYALIGGEGPPTHSLCKGTSFPFWQWGHKVTSFPVSTLIISIALRLLNLDLLASYLSSLWQSRSLVPTLQFACKP